MKHFGLGRCVGFSIILAALSLPLRAGDAVLPRQPGARDTCSVCGMLVSPHSRWLAQVVFADDSTAFFDGSKDLFKYLVTRGETVPTPRPGITAIFVTNYYQLKVIPARGAYYVAGSDVLGPMGPELVPHSTLAEAEDFLRDHGGRWILRFEEVTPERLDSLSGGRGRGM